MTGRKTRAGQIFAVFALVCSFSSSAFDIIAHRGASGFLPEHTLVAAALAHAQMPDYIEQDVVLSKDGKPVVLHDIHLETVTNVEEVFPDRAREDERFYVIDFTLAELKTLRVHERTNPQGKPVFPHRFSATGVDLRIATLDEHIQLIQELNRLRNTEIGFYIEIKSPAFHKKHGQDISAIVLDTVKRFDLLSANARLFLQCFDFAEIRRLRQEFGYTGQLVFLIGIGKDYDVYRTPEGIQGLTGLVNGIGPALVTMLPSGLNETPVPPAWVNEANKQGLLLHPYTYRHDVLPADIDAGALLGVLISQFGIDGIFTDQVPPIMTLLEQVSAPSP
ncbi:glycerophosphodiester phosphodiesterase [Alteromonas sp. CYL-A6]|uniref:glycerophosphodiester phosphodiesterase n=1 Tax=Alteromonas nitratireducens TaxID=3390813 RepID=UPI0034BA7957